MRLMLIADDLSPSGQKIARLHTDSSMFSFLKRGGAAGESGLLERTRQSRGWAEVLNYLQAEPPRSLRVLDFGTTSPSNINLLTSFGHSVYMANVVAEANKPDWVAGSPSGAHAQKAPVYDTERFAATALDFSGRDFDVVLLWDTADYLPPPLVPTLFRRLREVTRPAGRLLGFFHGKTEGNDTGYARYQITDKPELKLVGSEPLPVRQVIQNRQIEKYLDGFSTIRFVQGADNVREVIATR